jgi:hypothetical protein
VVSHVSATGGLGFFYQRFGRRKMGKAFLTSYQTCLEQPDA